MNNFVPTKGRFSVMIASDMDHEKVYAEIYCDERFVALISQERGPEHKVLELPGPGLVEERICREVSLEEFLRALQLASRKLDGD
jgi:hypothetical protein